MSIGSASSDESVEWVSCLHTGAGKEDIYETRDIDGGSICVCDRGKHSGADPKPISQQDG
jgi:hypothetical protein